MNLNLKLNRKSADSAKYIPLGPAFWTSLILQFFLALLLAFVPLFNLLGYEFCLAISLLASVLAGPVGISTVRHSKGDRSWFSLWLLATTANWIASIPAFLIISLNALRVQNCNFTQGVILFLLLPMATSLICSAWGVAVGLVIRRRFLSGSAFAVLWIAVAIINIWEVWSGPQILSYNQLAGWIAGPIYDDVIEPGTPLIMSRIFGLALSVALLILASWIGNKAALKIKRYGMWSSILFVAALCTAAGLWGYSGRLGFGRQRSALEKLLQGTTRTRHFLIHHVSDLDTASRKMLAVEHEFCLYQIKQLLGDYDLPTIDSWVFSDFSQKRRLLGAGRTQYTKPWQPAIYINGTSIPHSTLKHELVHAYASSFGSGPFAVSASHGILINPGITEGLAVAVDWPARRFSPHTWSAALRRIGKAPAIKNLFDPIGFWSASAGRSYTVAGSFVRFLLDTYGPAKLKRAYTAGTLNGIYPTDTSGLIKEWEKHLDEMQIDQWVEELAKLRFSRRSVFDRRCAHEIASLRARARRSFSSNRIMEARQALNEILYHIPSDISAQETLMEIDVREGKTERAISLAEKLVSRKDLSSANKTLLLSRMGDFMGRIGKLKRASELQQQVLEAHLSDSSDRTAVVKLLAMKHMEHAKAILELLDTGKLSALTFLDLKDVILSQPGWAEAWYILGRQLFNKKQYERAMGYLWHAGLLGLAHPSLAAENLRLIAVSLYYHMFDKPKHLASSNTEKIGNKQFLGTSLAIFTVMAQFPRHEGELLMARDWIQRLCFLDSHKEIASLTPMELIRTSGRGTIHVQE